jgi:hypothetical protein
MGSTTRRHRRPASHRVNPDVTGEHTALVAGLHAGDTDAFDRLFLLTELPRAIPPGDLVADRDFAGDAPRSGLPRLGLQMWSDRARYGSRAVEDGWRAIGFEMLPR